MKVALAQIDVVAGNPYQNVQNMLNQIEKAKTKGADVVAFPEMCVGGYMLSDKYNDNDYCRWLMSFNDQLREASDGIVVIYGNVYLEEHGKDWKPNQDGRKRKYNAAYIYQNKMPAVRDYRVRNFTCMPHGVQPKALLPNYRFFDDKRYFSSILDLHNEAKYVQLEDFFVPFLVEIDGKEISIGLELCEDLWCRDYRYKGESVNPTNKFLENGADYIINISASPWTHGKNRARDNAVKYLVENASKHNFNMVPFFYVNCVGAQNNGKNIITFDGGSTYYDEEGKILAMAKEPYKEELMVIDTDILYGTQFREERDVIREKYDAIIRGIRHIKDIMGLKEYPKFRIGLSGGIDSAVVAYLLVKAVGKDKVCAINIPSRFNSSKTKNVAFELAKELDIEYRILPIEDLIVSTSDLLSNNNEIFLTALMKENIQARIRGSSIMAGVAATDGALFTNNGNKVEMALGYCTAYGDLGGSICPIGDLLKTEVFELARYINKIEEKDIIPEILFPDDLYVFSRNKIPSGPELKENQVSEIKIGYHDYIIAAFMDYKIKSPEDILQWYLDGILENKLAEYGMK